MSQSQKTLPTSLILVGAGRMGSAMLSGWLAMGLPGKAISIIEPAPSPELMALCAANGVRLGTDATGLGAAEVVILAVKPQMLDAAAPSLAALIGTDTLIVSILAGKTIANIAARLPGASAMVRAMPNTPAAIGRGITGVAASPAVTPRQRQMADALLGAVGAVEWLSNESLIDAVTAVSGSGPAYVFLLAESLARAGEAAGLPADLAARLARATIEGSGELMRLSPDVAPSKLRENVTSPGGTTAAALGVLMGEEGLDRPMKDAVLAALRRAGELSG
jgi:pyrroline-5-carboxylate reductase